MATVGSESGASSADGRQERGVERLILFTDAVIAIVITLMVLEVKPPPVHTEQELLPALRALWHEYLAVGVSFIVIGIFWARHHRLFQWIRRLDLALIWINLLFLMSVSAIPFVTAVLAKHPQQAGTIIYALTVTAATLLLTLLWVYADSRRHTDSDLPAQEYRVNIVAGLATAAIFLGSVPVAFWFPHAAKAVWALVLAIAVMRRVALSDAAAPRDDGVKIPD